MNAQLTPSGCFLIAKLTQLCDTTFFSVAVISSVLSKIYTGNMQSMYLPVIAVYTSKKIGWKPSGPYVYQTIEEVADT